jgi:hypothetical protein
MARNDLRERASDPTRVEQELTSRQRHFRFLGVPDEQFAALRQDARADLLRGQHSENVVRGLQQVVPSSGEVFRTGRRSAQ